MPLRLVHHKHRAVSRGFTLVEMLVIAPVVLLVIAGLVSAMVTMIGDSIVANDRSSAAYNIQDTLSRIEQDSRVATSFMKTFSFLTSPQGRDGGTAPFDYSANGDLILAQQSTTASPYDTTRQPVYYANQPVGCGAGDISGNRVLYTRVIYFLQNNTLWRRTIVNTWDTNATPGANTVCNAPWQRDTCPYTTPSSQISNAQGSVCQGIDERMLDNVASFDVKYYDANGNTTSNPTQALTVSASITLTRTVSGNPITQTSVIRAVRRNDVAASPVPTAPVVSVYNQAVNTYNNPLLTSVQWSSPGAYAYTYQTKIGAGAWSSLKTTTDTFASIDSYPGATVSVKVTALNDTGTSVTTTFNTTTDIFTTLNLSGNWDNYSGTGYYMPQFTVTKDMTSNANVGYVMLRGLVSNGTGEIGYLPPGFRPAHTIMFTTLMGGTNAPAWIIIGADGMIKLVTSGDTAWVSLDPIRFIASNQMGTWTVEPPATTGFQCPTGCTSPWKDYTSAGGGGDYFKTGYTKDSAGRVHIYGLVNTTVPNNPPAYSTMANIPSSNFYSSSGAGGYDIYPTSSAYTYGDYAVYGNILMYRQGTASFYSMYSIYYPYSPAQSWTTPATMQNNWVNYNSPGTGYSPFSYIKGTDGVVMIRGLIKSGTATSGTILYNLPAGYCPSKEVLFITANAGPARARVDVTPLSPASSGCNLRILTNVNNGWLSLAGINYYAEQ